MKKVEILSPAGDISCLKAAIEAGCDAVYLAGKMFGARSFAGNFTDEELIYAINYAHLYGVKVYLTMNTIVYERETEKFINYVRFAHKNNVDAVLIQDLGMMDVIRKKFPNLQVHASTQMNIHNYEGALFAKKMNISRIVVARETSIDLINKIKKELDIEVEAFVHGALCVSYSGECLMSTLIGNRSGNRGTCSQCCRKPYDLFDDKGNKLNQNNYLLSMKDLCTIKNIPELIESGVDSLKIEGRMKRPEYVYLVTKMYRKAVDNYYENKDISIKDSDIKELKKMFNRSFTKGFIFNEDKNNITYEKRPNHQGIEIGNVLDHKNNTVFIKLNDTLNLNDGIRIIGKEDNGFLITKMEVDNKIVKVANKGDIVKIKYDKYVLKNSVVIKTTDYNQIKNIDNILKNKTRKVLIEIKAYINKNNFSLNVTDGKNLVSLNRNIVSKAFNKPISKELIIKQLSKTGNTVYQVDKITIDMDNNLFIDIKDINDLRRSSLEALNNKRLYKTNFIENDYYYNLPNFDMVNKNSILLNNEMDLKNNINKYDLIYTENKQLLNKNIIYKLPRIINKYANYNDKVLIGEVGSLIKYKKFDTDFSFNVVNSYTVSFLHELGAKKITLSYELSENQINLLIHNYKIRYGKNPNLEVIIDSYPEAMVCKFDINKKYNVKLSYLKDEYGNKYMIKSANDFMTVYNYKKVVLNEEKLYNLGVNWIRINL